MEFDRLLFWMALCALAPLLLNAARAGLKSARPLLLTLTIVLAIGAAGFLAAPTHAGIIAVLAWAMFLIAPRFVVRIYTIRVQERRLASAYRWAVLLKALSPLTPLRGQVRLLRALAAEDAGNPAGGAGNAPASAGGSPVR